MDYNILIFFVCAFIVTGGYMFLLHKIKKNHAIEDNSIIETLDVLATVFEFSKNLFADKFENQDQIEVYSELVIDAIEYMKVLSSDMTVDEKIAHGIDGLVDSAENLDIKLSDNDIEVLREVLKLAYKMHEAIVNK